MDKLGAVIAGVVTNLSRGQKFAVLLSIDVLMVPIATLLTGWFVKSPFSITAIACMSLAGLMASILLGLPRIKLNFYERVGFPRSVIYSFAVGVTGLIVGDFLYPGAHDTRHMLILVMSLVTLSLTTRIILRQILTAFYSSKRQRSGIIIYGAGQTGEQLAVALGTDDTVRPIAFIDDNRSLQKVLIAGLPVYSLAKAKKVIRGGNIDRVVLAMPSISRPRQARIARQLADTNCEVVALPSFASLVGQGDLIDHAQPVDPSDFLGRTGLAPHLGVSNDIYENRSVMITGAGGSIGAELTRQVLQCRPKRLILLDVSEHALYKIDHEIKQMGQNRPDCVVVPVLGSVTDADLVRRTIANYSVDTLMHAAAYKHVPLVEQNKLSGLHNNVIGTRVAVREAIAAGVSNFILISTDKAVQPTSVMGASKRLAELLVQDLGCRTTKTRCSIVRFGNVLGSSGSVVPLFEEQIARGGPITLTHNDVTRYFMTISEAVRLVLRVGCHAEQQEEQGQVYLLDMGDPVSIRTLATRMIEAAGYTVCDEENPQGDIEIVITGLRPGEKLHEKLTVNMHNLQPTNHPKILRVEESRLSELEIAAAIRGLTDALDDGDELAAMDTLHHWIHARLPRHEDSPEQSKISELTMS